ncbi:PTH2-domain-containing protein, partial [Microthyrium microscopicum]
SEEEEDYDSIMANDTRDNDSIEDCKLVLVVRTDLGMTKGKIAAQCSHATLACYKYLRVKEIKFPSPNSVLKTWSASGQAKIAVQAKSEDELLLLQAQAMSLGLTAQIIHDAGRTQIAAGSATVLGVGPGPKSLVDQVTGRQKLL